MGCVSVSYIWSILEERTASSQHPFAVTLLSDVPTGGFEKNTSFMTHFSTVPIEVLETASY